MHRRISDLRVASVDRYFQFPYGETPTFEKNFGVDPV